MKDPRRIFSDIIKILTVAFAVAFLIGIVFFRSRPGLSEDAKARLLAGLTASGQEPRAAAIDTGTEWKTAAAKNSIAQVLSEENIELQNSSSRPNLLAPKSAATMRGFLSASIRGAYKNARFVLYPFSGPDFPYPGLFFPKMQELVLIGLESVGDLPDVENLYQSRRLSENMRKLAAAFSYLPWQSYFETQVMAVMLKEFGVCQILSAGLVASGNRIVNLEKFSAGKTPGVEIRYLRPDGSAASLTYLQQDLSDAGLARAPEFERFLRAKNFDTLYLKAAQFLLFHSNFSRFREMALASVRYVVESDDGIPLHEFSQHPNIWRTKIFGLYARPNVRILGDRYQPDFFAADAFFVCQSGDQTHILALERIWSDSELCTRIKNQSPPSGLEWGGFLPFPYGYGYRISETPEDLRAVTSNLIYAERR